VSHHTINFVIDDTQISGISKEPVNILFNPSTIAKKDVWQINLIEILKILVKILEQTGKKDLKVVGMAALSSSLIYRMKVESIFALQKAAMEKKPLINRRDVDIDILDIPYRHESTYPVSLDELLDLLENLIGSIANPSSRSGRLDFEPAEVPDFNEYFISFEKIVAKYENNEIYCSNITCDFENNKIPTRIKFGLDVGMRNLKSKLPCNICFNSKMGNPLIENKPGSFHWAPIFPNRNSVITIGNFSTLKNYQRESEIEMTFFRKEDSSTISKKFTLKANCEERIYSNDADIRQFIKTEGWVTIKANNPYIQGFYFNFNNSGSVSGDHLF